MGQPLVSIVIPVFNGMPYLAEAYASAKGQSYPNVEICLVDGGSSDESVAWLRNLKDPGTTVSYLPPGTPAAVTWTSATQAASGDLIKLLCQDDILYPNAVADQVADLLANPGAGAAIAQRDVISASGKVLYRRRGTHGLRAGLVRGQDALRAAYLSGTNIFGEPHALLFRREALLAAMPWRAQRPYLLDLDSYAVAFEQPGFTVFVRKGSIGAFRISTSSWSTRLVASQKEQLAAWQSDYARHHNPSTALRKRASVGLASHNLSRRIAYAWLYVKGDMG